MRDPWTVTVIDLLTEAVRCSRERMYVAAGMWLSEAKEAAQNADDKELAKKLWEAVHEAIEASQRETTATNSLHQLRGGRSIRPSGLPMGHASTERGADPHL